MTERTIGRHHYTIIQSNIRSTGDYVVLKKHVNSVKIILRSAIAAFVNK